MGNVIRNHVEVQVSEINKQRERSAEEAGRECEADLAEVEAVHGWEDEGEDLEEGVVDAVEEGGIDVYEEDGGVFDGVFDGFNKC